MALDACAGTIGKLALAAATQRGNSPGDQWHGSSYELLRRGIVLPDMQRALLIQVIVGLLIGGSLGALMGYFGKCTSGTCPLTANPWRGAFIGAMIGGLFAYSAGGSRTADDAVGEQASLQITSAEEFNNLVLQTDKPVLVDFYSTTCGPCRKLAPTIEKLAKQYEGRAVVSKVNVGKLPQLASRYAIQGVPSVLFFHQSKEVRRLVGLQPASAYIEILDNLGQPKP